MERLEDRLAPATWWVSRLADDALPGTLRWAIAQASDGDTVQFTSGLGGTVNLVQGTLGLSKNLTISGAEASVAVQCTDQPVSRVFTVALGKTCEIDDLTVFNGGILNSGTLTLNSVTVSHSHADQGGGIDNTGTLTLNGSFVYTNSASSGGGIYNTYHVVCSNTSINYNTADGNGGGIYNDGSSASVQITDGSWVNFNSSGNCGGGIFNWGGTVVMTGGGMDQNVAQVDGGGLAADLSTSNVTLTSVQITGNSVTRNGGKGGGFFIFAGSLTLNSITLSDNRASVGAGGAYLAGANVTDNNPVQLDDPIVQVSSP